MTASWQSKYAENQWLPHTRISESTQDRFVREMAGAEWRLRRCRQHQETLLTEACHEIAAADPALDTAQVQVRAFDHLLAKSNTLALLMRYETKFERQYERAYRGWIAYQKETRRNQLRMVSAEPPDFSQRSQAVTDTNIPSEPNPAARTPRNAPCPLRFRTNTRAAATAMPPRC